MVPAGRMTFGDFIGEAITRIISAILAASVIVPIASGKAVADLWVFIVTPLVRAETEV